jgi:hypothetical protein
MYSRILYASAKSPPKLKKITLPYVMHEMLGFDGTLRIP